MLCLSGFELHSRWVPLICHKKVRRSGGRCKVELASSEKNVELNILKSAHKLLYDETFPEYLKLNLHKVSAYSLGSSIAPVLSIPRQSGTSQHLAATIFNKLPVAIRNITMYNSFCRSIQKHLLFKVQLTPKNVFR